MFTVKLKNSCLIAFLLLIFKNISCLRLSAKLNGRAKFDIEFKNISCLRLRKYGYEIANIKDIFKNISCLRLRN